MRHKRLESWMRMISGRKPAVHFIHVGKTGGLALSGLLAQFTRRDRTRCQYRICIPGDHDFTLRDVPADEFCFFFIRDPIDRYVSGFLSRLRAGKPELDYPHSEAETEVFRRFPTPNDLAEALSDPDPQTRAAADHAFTAVRHLKRDYPHYLVSPEYLDERSDSVVFIGQQETFDRSWQGLCDCLNLRVSGSELARVHATPPGSPTGLSDVAVSNLRQKLRADYAICDHLKTSPRWRQRFGTVETP